MGRITNIACVGAGLIGQGWATQFAAGGLNVVLYDTDGDTLAKAPARIRSNLDFLESHGLAASGVTDVALDRIRTTGELADALGNADYVQESAREDYSVKEGLFRKMDALAPERTILASSTSGLLMSRIQKSTTRPERCVLAHPFLPVHLMPLVEVVGGRDTSAQALNETCELMRRIGKSPVLLNKEVPGFIVNRLQAALLREAVDLVGEGVATAEEVDRAFLLSVGMRGAFMGPLLRAHFAGNGIERFFEIFTRSYQVRLETMATWSAFPEQAAQATIESVKAMSMVRTQSLEELKQWRDEMLAALLKFPGLSLQPTGK